MTTTIRLKKMHECQKHLLFNKGRFNVCAIGRRFGKTSLAINLLCEAAIEGKKTAYFAPTYKMMLEVWQEVKNTLKTITTQSNQIEKRIELLTGGIIEFWSLEKEDSARGRKYHLVIIDEAAMARNLENAWQQAIRPTLTDFKGEAWFFSTPKGRNFFFKLWNCDAFGFKSFKFTTYDNPFLDKNEIEAAKKELPEQVFAQEYLADFSENRLNPFGYEFIQKCKQKKLSENNTVVFGIDLAKSVDYTVIIGLDKDGQMTFFKRFQKDWLQTEKEILRLPNAPIIIDSTGVGDSILESLQRKRQKVFGFKFSNFSKQQIIRELVSSIQAQSIGIFEDNLIRELESFEFVFKKDGSVRYEAPSGLHDDCVIALALANSFKNKILLQKNINITKI